MEQLEFVNDHLPGSHDYEKKIRGIHDYLYANSSIKTPEKIITELAKLFQTLIFLEKKNLSAPHLLISAKEAQELRQFKSAEVKRLSTMIRDAYAKLPHNKSKESLLLSDKDIAYIVGLLHGIPLAHKQKDYVGDALESIRTDWVKKHGGQFFTDQKVTALAMEMIQFSPAKGETFADICCGTGGFLIAAVKYAREKLAKSGHTEKQIFEILDDGIVGHELDAEVASIANSTLRGISAGKWGGAVKNGNSLEKDVLRKNGLNHDSFDCLASNPPFGVKITVKDPEILKNFELAKSGYKVTPKPPDILLLEQNINLLKPKTGRLAIVLPYQLLSGPQAFFVREWLLRHCQILAVIDLPKETFQPHTGTRTSLVVLRKRAKTLAKVDFKNDPAIFMSTPRFIGHDRRGNPIYRKDGKGQFTQEILSDIETVAEDFKVFSTKGTLESEISFVCSPEKIMADSQLRINAEFFAPRNEMSFSAEESDEYYFKPLGELVQKISYPGRFKRDYVAKGPESVPFLGGSNITELIVNTEKYLSIHDPKYESLKVTAGTILITRSGTTGIVSTVPKSWDGYAISEHVIRIVPNSEKLPAGYLIAFFRSEYAQTQIKRGIFGSVIDEITPEHLSEIIVPIPKAKKQVERISEKVLAAEKSRDQAIAAFNSVSAELNELFGGLSG